MFDLPTLDEYLNGTRKTLGWQVLNWGSTFLGQPDGAFKGDVWQYTREQCLFILRFYEVDEHGRFTYRRAVLERSKGWGKSPLLAAICCTELLGPTRFDGWDADGEPVGVPAYSSLIQIAAISDSQADNTMTLVGGMLAEGEAVNAYPGLDILLSKVTTPDGRKIEKVTASPRGRQGNRSTFIVLDETHLWLPSEKGPELADALRNNATKMDARTIETTNAHAPGENSVAEQSYQAYIKMQAGETIDKGLLFDTREVHVDDIYDYDKAYPALIEAYGDACQENGGWLNLGRVWADINDPSWTEQSARRFFFNEKREGKSSWLKENEWKRCKDPTLSLEPGEKFALGFKGSVRNGSTVLVACRLSDNALFSIGYWEKPDKAPVDWEVDYVTVDYYIRRSISRPECVKMIADPENWQELLGRIEADHPGKIEGFWISNNHAKQARYVEQFETTVKSQRLSWKDENISNHILNCYVTVLPNGGKVIRKETPNSKRFIHAAQAAVLALEAAMLSIEEGALRKNVSNEIYSF